MRLPFAAQSAADVRQSLARWLRRVGATEELIADAGLVVTELIGNAVRHAGPLAPESVGVRWRYARGGLLLSVYDGGGPTEPIVEYAELDDERGRGMAIVEALSLCWWTEEGSNHRAVHVQLPLG